jgi:HSP20 family molecular chaperone IbpA
MTDSQELKVREKQAVDTAAEQTKPGPVFTPSVDIFETEKAITLLADMPGVKAEDLNVDLRDDTLTLPVMWGRMWGLPARRSTKNTKPAAIIVNSPCPR